ncbi:hypothetical protein QOZ80_2BG0168730 [Eleusine coracana subsp. coracana]|nr:hypothetical protein QOZ80_2BG0168730 [Eleusine coracana subsp. coracana]
MEKQLLPLVHKHAHGGGERMWERPWRWAKTAFFVAAMLASLLLVCAPPLLVVILDLALPPALFSATLRAGGSSSFAAAAAAQARAFDFRSSLVDLPALSAARALIILCAYALYGGGEAYFWVVVACSTGSLSYALAKAAAMLPRHAVTVAVPEAMIGLSLTLAVAHLAVAYRTSCRERRRQLVYRIDVEAVRLKGGHQTPKSLKQCSV